MKDNKMNIAQTCIHPVSPEKKQSQVAKWNERLVELVGDLLITQAELNGSLQPVLRSNEKTVPNEQSAADPELVPLADSLRSVCHRLEGAIDNNKRMLSLLEL
jgi:hypothetical protein